MMREAVTGTQAAAAIAHRFEVSRLLRSAAAGLASLRAAITFETLLSLFSPVLMLGVWETLVRAGLLDWHFFPAPSAIAGTFGSLIANGQLPIAIKDTLGRVAVGFVLGAVPGLVLGIVMGLSPMVRAVLKPMVDATFPIPKIAVLPLIMLIFGLGELSKYIAVATGVVFLVLINTMRGVMNIDQIYLDVAKNSGASRLQTYWTVALPGALPDILTGCQLGLGVALLVIVATEFVGADSGVGYLIWVSWQMFAVEKMYCGLIVMALFGFVLQQLVDGMQGLLIPWKPELHASAAGWHSGPSGSDSHVWPKLSNRGIYMTKPPAHSNES